ncbi:unnamed protein product [Cyprideis torosa]|uniref:Uncharacterized protein n=1 Tax=Cyprideis torosa TaxID=163714 RepID=A0A7R8ZV80_9CRUS|nr:unnamed protein product [Cyprideis torosa]CAG0902520.1 unnamed protein product [Cyprideis torosa]
MVSVFQESVRWEHCQRFGSILNIGAVIGDLMLGLILGLLGTKKAVAFLTIPYVASWLMCLYPSSVTMVLAGRLLAGLCVDLRALVSVMYMNDFASKELRGRLQSLSMVFMNIGSILCYASGLFLDWAGIALFNDMPSPDFLAKVVESAEDKKEPHDCLPQENGDTEKAKLKEISKTGSIRQVLAAFFLSTSGLMYGFTVTYTAVAIPSWTEDSDAPFNMTTNDISLHGSIINVGAVIGAVLVGIIVTSLGTKKVVALLTIPYIVGWLMCLYPSSVSMVLAGRLLAGLSADSRTLVSLMYLNDFVSKELRGRLQSLAMVFMNVGNILCYAFGLFLDWSGIALFNAIFPIPLAMITYYFPEAPTHLLEKGSELTALRNLSYYRGNIAQSVLVAEFEEKKADLARKRRREAGGIKDLMSPIYIRPMLICLAVAFFRQTCGIFSILAFTVDIFDMTGTSMNPYVASIIMSSLQLVSQLFSASLADKFGRKRFTLFSLFVCGSSQGIFGVYYFLKSKPDYATTMEGLGIIPLVALITLMMGYGMGLYNCHYSIPLEILPVKIRTQAMSICMVLNAAVCFVVVLSFYSMTESALGMHGTFWTYGCSCLILFLIIAIYVPESRGMTLAEVERKMSESALEKMNRKRAATMPKHH